MIGRIRGVLLEKRIPQLLVDVQGLGYDVQVSMQTFFELPDTGQEVMLHCHFVVREDAQLLYGFSSTRERQLFRDLIRINGVGPKVALAILSGVNVDEFIRIVQQEDIAALVRVPGIGRKTAERLLVEMRDRLDAWGVDKMAEATPAATASLVQEESESALIALGYKPQEAGKMIAAALRHLKNPSNSQELIKFTLKNALK